MAAAEIHAENKVFSIGERIGDQVHLAFKGKVALLQLGEQRLEIPARHMSWQTLVDLACAHRKVKLNALNVASELVEDLIKALSQAFLSGLSRLFQRGLRRDYQSQVQPSEILRGDILFSRWFGPNESNANISAPLPANSQRQTAKISSQGVNQTLAMHVMALFHFAEANRTHLIDGPTLRATVQERVNVNASQFLETVDFTGENWIIDNIT